MDLDRIDELLDAVEAVPETEREEHLARICPDPELRRAVMAMLAVEEEAWGYLDRFSDELLLDGNDAADLAGRRIGSYRLLRLLGQGGMGLVYEAERADGAFEQRVALKLLTTALAGTEARRGFLAERQILAGLEHPSIAHIVDGGVTEDGTPWFAMEYLAGLAVDAYCDHRRLGIRERLELFLQVCDAVEHAHRRLVVHRDLKPSNVLVTEEGKVKLLDFGIAKLLDADGADRRAPPTRTAVRMLTPEYASPEQVRGEPVTTASDVYQLGLLLYELLTGHRPYSLQHHGAAELERVICEQAPTRPSEAILRQLPAPPTTDRQITGESAAKTGVEAISRARGMSPTRLQRRLRGDLDKIVIKALSKEPERRYGSADRLAQDIRRHLEGLPVTARADTWIYRGRKFLERHALGASATAAALLLVLLLIAGMTMFHTARIRSERDRAQAEAAKAEQVSRFLTRLFEGADPSQARGAELTARELLDRGAARVDRELTGQPEVRAEMLQVLGRTYSELGHYGPAERLLTRALELRRSRLGARHPDAAGTASDLGRLLQRRGAEERARELLEAAARDLESAPGRDAPMLAEVLHNLGDAYRNLGRYEEARNALRRALAIESEVSGPDSLPTAQRMLGLGTLLHLMGLLERAEDLFARALAIHEREIGDDHPQVGILLMYTAIVRLQQGKIQGLEEMFRRSLAIQEKAYGSTHIRVGITLNNLGDFLTVVGRHDEAVEVLRQALEVQVAAVGPDYPDAAYPLASLGDAHLAAGRIREARDNYRRSVTVRGKALDTHRFDPLLFHALVGLGRTSAQLDDPHGAGQSLERALALWNRAPESRDIRLRPSLLYLGRWLVEQQRCSDAIPLLRQAAELPVTPPDPRGTARGEVAELLATCSG